jgi:hypothetical protein
VSSENFHIYVVSNARAGLYRTLLSIWKLDPRPSHITIITSQGLTPEIEKSIFTVSEDTSDIGPNVRIHEKRNDLQSEILADSVVSSFQFSGFISERDMFLPDYSNLIEENMEINAINTFPYHQRTKFGNSRVIFPSNQKKIPLSAVVMSQTLICTLFTKANFLLNLELTPFLTPLLIEGGSRLILQSNIRSAYDL